MSSPVHSSSDWWTRNRHDWWQTFKELEIADSILGEYVPSDTLLQAVDAKFHLNCQFKTSLGILGNNTPYYDTDGNPYNK